jgi:hypothetical protein
MWGKMMTDPAPSLILASTGGNPLIYDGVDEIMFSKAKERENQLQSMCAQRKAPPNIRSNM